MTAPEGALGAQPPRSNGDLVLLTCTDCWATAYPYADALNHIMAYGGLDKRVILRASLPRRYGGGTGAGLQLCLPLCQLCPLEG